ncbi:hypothetical protein K438DRAFT_1868691 [Mycena galopus ATCC 62051]|nr:hypothetical protein K438DRAFT_1868691 [Mycena galopus ATCC 62051]
MMDPTAVADMGRWSTQDMYCATCPCFAVLGRRDGGDEAGNEGGNEDGADSAWMPTLCCVLANCGISGPEWACVLTTMIEALRRDTGTTSASAPSCYPASSSRLRYSSLGADMAHPLRPLSLLALRLCLILHCFQLFQACASLHPSCARSCGTSQATPATKPTSPAHGVVVTLRGTSVCGLRLKTRLARRRISRGSARVEDSE